MSIDPRRRSSATDERARHLQEQHRRLRADDVDEEGRDERAAGRTDEEDVDRPKRRAHAPQPVRHDRLQDRPDHRERGHQEDLRDHADDGEGRWRWASSTGSARRWRRAGAGARPAAGPWRGPPGSGRRSPAANGQDGDDEEAAEAAEQARSSASRPNSLLDVQALEDRRGEQPEADGGEGEQRHVHRLDLLEPGERRLDRHRRRPGVDDLAEHVLHLVLASGGLGDPEAKNASRTSGDAEHEERPAPPVVAAGERGDGAHECRADGTTTSSPEPIVAALMPPADADRIGVGDQRRVDRGGGGLATPRRRSGPGRA